MSCTIDPRWLKIMKPGLLLIVSNVLELNSVVSLISLNFPVTLTMAKIHKRLANRHSNTFCMGQRKTQFRPRIINKVEM